MPTGTAAERDQLASEYALGILDGDELNRARALALEDSEFRAAVARWAGRLAPLLVEVGEATPDEDVWRGIQARTGKAAADSSNVVDLTRRLSMWRGVSFATSALAAALAMILVAQPAAIAPPIASPTAVPPPLVAMVGADKDMKLVASWDPAGRRLVLAVAGDMPSDTRHSHELWVIPSGGKPRSLGTMPDRPRMHMSLEQTLAELMRQGATIAITVEPPGGSPTGAPTGPMVASGMLETA